LLTKSGNFDGRFVEYKKQSAVNPSAPLSDSILKTPISPSESDKAKVKKGRTYQHENSSGRAA
jgi:hypothetical protein